MKDLSRKNNMTYAKRINILLIEDSILVYKLVEKYFKNSNYNLLYAKTANDAFKIMDFIKPDLILLDILLADISGYRFLELIGSSAENCDIPVVILSGLNKSEDVAKAFKLGAKNYILKPFSSFELLVKIDYIVKKRQSIHA